MKTVGIIAEYNPFHKGHEYQIKKAKEISGADVAVIIMSGNFVQRGEPAIIDKYTRTKMALSCGADVVFELPFIYATASAENFALGAVGLLHFLGVDSICFGSECGDVDLMKTAANTLLNEPQEYKEKLKEALSCGKTFPEARQVAMEGLEGSKALSNPNDLLGVEYIKALQRFRSNMEIYTVKRFGALHNDEQIKADSEIQSATAIRSAIKNASITQNQESFGNVHKIQGQQTMEMIAKAIPKEAYGVLNDYISKGGAFADVDDFSNILNYKIYSVIRDDATLLMNYADVSEPIANKITKIYCNEHFNGKISELIARLKTRDLTYTRISRALMHILLDIYVDAYQMMTPYARVLGFNESGQAFLKDIKDKCRIPVITKVADGEEYLRKDIYASTIYALSMKEKHGFEIQDDYRHGLVIQ